MGWEELKKYERIRKIVETLYTYGTESRKTLDEMNLLSSVKYDKDIQSVYSLFRHSLHGDGVLSEAYKGKDKFLRITRDYFSDRSRILAASYGLSKPSSWDVMVSFVVFSALALGREIKIPDVIARVQGLEGGDQPSDATIRRAVREMISFGYLERRPGGLLQRTKNPLPEMASDQLRQLYCLALFFSCAGYPRIGAQDLVRSIRRVLRTKGIEELPNPFLFRGNAPRSVFDEETVYVIWEAIQARRVVELTWRGKRRRVMPVSFRPDTRMGRWYLFCVQDGVPAALRLSYVSDIKVTKEKYSYEEAGKAVSEVFSNTYISPLRNRDGAPLLVEVELLFEEGSDQYRAFLRENLQGSVEHRPDGGLLYRAFVNDVGEIRPFLRSFGGWVRVLPSPDHRLDQELTEEYERMLTQYGLAATRISKQ